MENKETITEAALRETLEEAEAKISDTSLYTIINVPHVDQVHIFFLGKLVDGKYGAGIESMEVQLFSEADIPWEEVAFKTVHLTLKHYFADRATNHFPVRIETITASKK